MMNQTEKGITTVEDNLRWHCREITLMRQPRDN